MKVAKSVTERFKEAIADANAFIDKRAAEVSKVTPGVPLNVVRQCITRGVGCACQAALSIAEEVERETA